MSKKPPRWLGPLLMLGTVAVLAGGLELGVRTFIDDGMNFNIEMWKYARDVKQRSSNPLIGHEHRAHAHSFLMGVDVATNSLGHRDREIAVARQPGVRRVTMLGDSFIEGWGVPAEDTICKRLERLFARDGLAVEVMNTGVGNYNTVMEVEAFFQRDAVFNPDLVVLNYTMNDAEPVPSYGSAGFLARNSEAAVFVVGGLDGALRLGGVRKSWEDYYLGLYKAPGWERARAAVARLARETRERGMGLMIVNWPELHDVTNYRLDLITNSIRSVAQQERLPFVDLLLAVNKESSEKLWVTPPDPHPNAYANGLYAEYLYPFLKQELLHPSPSH